MCVFHHIDCWMDPRHFALSTADCTFCFLHSPRLRYGRLVVGLDNHFDPVYETACEKHARMHWCTNARTHKCMDAQTHGCMNAWKQMQAHTHDSLPPAYHAWDALLRVVMHSWLQVLNTIWRKMQTILQCIDCTIAKQCEIWCELHVLFVYCQCIIWLATRKFGANLMSCLCIFNAYKIHALLWCVYCTITLCFS